MKYKPFRNVPRRCPVCDDKRTTASAIATHNIKAAQDGCRRYPSGD